MGTGGLGDILPAGSVVKLEIVVGAGGAVAALNQTSQAFERTARSARRARRRMLRFRSAVATVTKALLSMVAVLIAFNLLITLPQAIFRGFVTVLRAAIKTTSEFEQRVLSLQAILASTLTFSEDPIENFVRSGRVAAAVIESLALQANKMVISLEEAVIVFQTLVATGAQGMVRTMEELVDLTILLGNAIAGITVGQQRQRQLAEETRSLITGQLRSTSLLGRLLFKDTKELNAFNREMERTGRLSQEIEQKLIGFALAAEDFATTFEGLTTTMETFLQILAKRSLGGIFKETEKQISGLFDQLAENMELFDLLAANLAASFRVISQALAGIVSADVGFAFDSVEEFFISLIKLVPAATAFILDIIFKLRNAALAFNLILQAILLIVAGMSTWLELLSLIVRWIRDILPDALGEIADRLLSSSNQAVVRIKALVDAGEAFLNSQRSSVETQALMNNFLSIMLVELIRIKKERKDLADLQDLINSGHEVDLTLIIASNKELLKRSGLLRRELSTITEIIRLSKSGQLSDLSGILAREPAADVQERAIERIHELERARRFSKLKLGEVSMFGAKSPEQAKELRNQISALDSEINSLLAGVIAIDSTFAQLANTTFPELGQALKDLLAGDFMKKFVDSFKEGGKELKLSLKDTIKTIIDFLVSAETLAALGNAIAAGFENMFRGLQGFGKTMKEFMGQLIIALGQAVIVMGVAAVAAGILTLNGELVARGLIAIAAGAAAIAAGVALTGGSGGGTGGGASGGGEGAVPTFTFDQEMINVQQSFLEATENLNESTSNFQRATNNLTSMPAGEVVIKGNAEQGGAARILSTDLKKGSSIGSGRSIARTLGGN